MSDQPQFSVGATPVVSTVFRTPRVALVFMGIVALPFVILAPVVLWEGLTYGDPGRLVFSLFWCGFLTFMVYDQGVRRAVRVDFDGTTFCGRSAFGRTVGAFRSGQITELRLNGGFRWIAYGDGTKLHLGAGNVNGLFTLIQSTEQNVPAIDNTTIPTESPTESYRSNASLAFPFVLGSGGFAAFGAYLLWSFAGVTGGGAVAFVGLVLAVSFGAICVGLLFFWPLRVVVDDDVCLCDSFAGRRVTEFGVAEISEWRAGGSWVSVRLSSGRTVRLFVMDQYALLTAVRRTNPNVHVK